MDYAQHDEDFGECLSKAALAHLVVGQTLYLNDPRNTPVEIQSCDPATASFSVRVSDFEDLGAQWVLPFWDISKFRIKPQAKVLTETEQSVLKDACEELDRTEQIVTHYAERCRTQSEIAQLQTEISVWLGRNYPDLPRDQSALETGKQASEEWSAALEALLKSRDLTEIDQTFVAQYASNPNAGEFIKGHRIVLAEMGCTSYQGHVVRDPKIFDGVWAKPRRRAHILTRLAFMRAMLSALHMTSIPLFRTIYGNHDVTKPKNTGFVSTTFCADVAASLFLTGQKTRFAATYWQRVPPERLFMSYYETPDLSRRFQEAEAVLLFDRSNRLF